MEITEEILHSAFVEWDNWQLFAYDCGRRLWARSGHSEFRVNVGPDELYRGQSFNIAARVFVEPYGNYLVWHHDCPNSQCKKPISETLTYTPDLLPITDGPELIETHRITLLCRHCREYAMINVFDNERNLYASI